MRDDEPSSSSSSIAHTVSPFFASRVLTPPVTTLATSASNSQKQNASADFSRRMLCGGVAGMVAKTVTNPLERIKMLSQTGEHGIAIGSSNSSGKSTGGKSTSVWNIYRTILRNEGVRGLWAGNGANLVRIFPSKAIVFSSHDFYKSLFRKYTNTGGGSGGIVAQPLQPVWTFLAGGLAGMTATAVTYPLDLARGRISGKLATSRDTKAYTGIVQTLMVTVKDEGVAGVYKGITPTLIGSMPYVGIQFGTVGLLERTFPLNDNTPTTPLRKMLFGGLGGVTAGLVTYPNDTIRRLLQLQGSRGSSHEYRGYWDCVRRTYQECGVTRFYRGLGINLIRMAPNTAVQFGTYEFLKQQTAMWSL